MRTADAMFEPRSMIGIISEVTTASRFPLKLGLEGVVTDHVDGSRSPAKRSPTCGSRFQVGQRYVVLGQESRPPDDRHVLRKTAHGARWTLHTCGPRRPVVPGRPGRVEAMTLSTSSRSRHGKTSPVAASLLAANSLPRLEGPSLTQLLFTDCEESADILAAEINPSRSTSA